MNITVVTGPFQPLPPAGCGAVETIWLGVSRSFAAKGHHVSLVSCSKDNHLLPVIEGNLTFKFIKGQPRSGRIIADIVKDFPYSWRAISEVCGADIVILNSFWLPVLLPFFRNRYRTCAYSIARYPKGQMWLYSRANRLYCVSNAIAAAVSRECSRVAPLLKTIPNPIDTEVLVPPERSREISGSVRILYTGRIHPEKGIHLLIAAFRNFVSDYPTSELQIVGPSSLDEGGGGPGYMERLNELANGLSISFVSPVYTKRELCTFLQEAHIYCYPSLAEKGESFGVAPLEAMATGLAPVVSDLSCFRDFICDGNDGIIFNHRSDDPVKALSNALRQVIRDDCIYAQMGRAASVRAREFSYTNIADLYLRDFEQLLAEGPMG